MITELRIGNKIKGIYGENKETCTVIGLETMERNYIWVEGESCEVENYDSFEPIPLTEQWLIDFGFKKRVLHDTVTEYYKNRLTITYLKVYNSFETTFKGIVIDNKHVHQLQNLYFALTGDEMFATSVRSIFIKGGSK